MSVLNKPSKPPAERRPFASPDSSSSRSPCPALNALANHGYIPHSGQSIPFFTLALSIRKVYSLSTPLAFLLTVTGFILCGHFTLWAPKTLPRLRIFPGLRLDLHDLARHGKIEHDGSLVHADVVSGEEYAPCAPDVILAQDFFSHASANTQGTESKEIDAFCVRDLARIRISRNHALSSPLDSFHQQITMGEIALIPFIFGLPQEASVMQRIVPRDWLQQWFVEERLPETWTVPSKRTGVLAAAKLGRLITQEMENISKDDQEDC